MLETRIKKDIKSIALITLCGLIIGLSTSLGINSLANKRETLNSVTPIYKTISELKVPATLYPISSEEYSKPTPDYNKINYQTAIRLTDTPGQVQFDFLNEFLTYDYKKAKRSNEKSLQKKDNDFREIYSKKKGVCVDYAVSAAALLQDNGYPPLILVLSNKEQPEKGHAVFLLKDKETNLFGALGNTPFLRDYFSVKELVKNIKFRDNITFDKYAIVNLDDNFKREEWIKGKVNLQAIEIDKWIELKD